MTNLSSRPPGERSEETAVLNQDDDISDVTPPGIGGLKRKEGNPIEKTVKFRFIHKRSTDHQAHPSQIHLHWIQIVQEEFGKAVIVMTNNNKVMPKVDTLTWTKTQHAKQFNLQEAQFNNNNNSSKNSTTHGRQSSSTADRERASFIVHRVRMTISLTELKSSPRVHDLLRQHNCFLTEHRWTEDVWNTTQLGFMQGLDPQYYDVTKATEKVNTELKKHFPNKTKIPKFQLAFSTPSINYNGHQIRTKAYAIETEKQNSMELMMIFKHAYREKTEFIPFQMRNKHPEAYTRILLQQTKILSHNHVIIINHMSTDALYYLSDRIRTVNGVRDLVNANKKDYPERHKVLVHKDDFNGVRKILLEQLQKWYHDFVPEDAKPPGADPRIPEVAPLNSDACSSGEGTYMSSSVNTAMSYDSTLSNWTLSEESKQMDSESHNSTTSAVNLTWAQRVKGNTANTPPSHRSNKSQATPSQITIDEEIISDLASSKAEVDELRKKLISLEQEKEKQQRDMEQQAAHQKREMELHVAEQKLEMERQVESQRREMEAKLDEQRKQFESQAAAQQLAFEKKVDNQIATAFQQHTAQGIPPATQPAPDYTKMFENHDRQLQLLTTMMEKMVQPQVSHAQSNEPNGKRAAVIDLTVDTESMYGSTHTSLPIRTDGATRKRQDKKQTPQKNQRHETQYHTPDHGRRTRRHSVPSPATESSESDHPSDYQRSLNQWLGYQYDCDPQTPMSYTDPRHPLHPGPEDDHDSLIDDDIPMSNQKLDPYASQPGVFDDCNISPRQLADIQLQHKNSRSPPTTPMQTDDTHTELSAFATGSTIGNNKRQTQTTPVEIVTQPQQKHD